MDGIINIYKPQGMTSFSCVSRVRRLTGAEKAGHAGTLDPQATGCLPVCLGKATRCTDLFLKLPKRYRGEILFGIRTDTCDIWGTPLLTLPADDGRLQQLSREATEKAAALFVGEIEQVPPAYAAVKIGGVPAYKLARQGKQFEMRKRQVTVYEITVLAFGRAADGYPRATVEVACSRGTYIRSLFRDLGEQLALPACMSALERTEYGFLQASDAILPEQLETMTEIPVYPVDYLMRDLPAITLDAHEEQHYRNGIRLRLREQRANTAISGDGASVRIYTKDGRLLATAKVYRCESGLLELRTDTFFDCKGGGTF